MGGGEHPVIALLAPAIAAVAVPAFAPPLDRPLRYSVSETRVEAGRTLKFEVVRQVTFRAAADGVVAEVETLSATGDAGPAGRSFVAMARAMIGRRVAITLDRAGKTVEVADLDAVWDAQVSAIATTVASKDATRDALVARLVAPLRAAPRPTKLSRIGDMVAPLIGDPIGAARPARAISLPARTPDGASALLPGTERVVLTGDGALQIERHAAGGIAGTTMEVVQRRRLDPRSGLATRTEVVTTIGTGETRLIVTRSSRVLLPVL